MEGDKHGRGVFRWPDGSYYEGDFDHNVRSGEGKLVMTNGKSYEGLWRENAMHGRGRLRWPND